MSLRHSPARADIDGAIARSFLGDIRPELAELAIRGAIVHRARAGEVFAEQGDPHRCALLIAGLAREFLTLQSGRERTVRDVEPGAAIGVAGMTGLVSPISVQAVMDSHVLELDDERLHAMANEHPQVATAIAREVTRRFHDTIAVLAADVGPSRQRLARRLLDAATENRDEPMIASLSHPQLADQIGCSREWVTKTLGTFRSDGLIATGRGHVRVLDPMRLHVIANAWHTIAGANTGKNGAGEREPVHR